MKKTTLTITYNSSLDGLRAIAVLLVVFFHGGLNGFHGGYLGVDIFFVLSGFLISRILLNELIEKTTIDLLAFYRRRVLRLFPGLFSMILLTCLYGWITGNLSNLEIFRNAIPSLLYVSNWSRALGFGYPQFLGHTWSLAIEEQYYLLCPLFLSLLYLLSRKITLQVLVIVAILLLIIQHRIALIELSVSIDRLYNGLDCRLDAILVGTIPAIFQVDRPQKKSVLMVSHIVSLLWLPAMAGLVYLFAIYRMEDKFMYYFGFSMAAVCSMIIIWAVEENTPLKRLLSIKPLPYLGKLSYSIYLWHYPIFYFLRQDYGLSHLSTMMIGIPFCLILSIATHELIEKQFLKFRHIDSPSSFLKYAPAGLTGIGMMLGLILIYYAYSFH